ncbi:BPI fold-containing family B member 3-like [Eublepharis macularius]|uniref:BPI fold-containing family B member 3-like n=1 Tax=Eublepharis macularius TaxID=481883 RepID=A0AA97JDR7_EUBMA|nr:BPI fold-containing family B member 3-like [Eublepharis macularius]
MKGLLDLDAQNSVSGGKLVTAASLSRLELLLESSQAGISDVSTLVPHCRSLLNETFMPVINAHLHVGFPLPSILNMKYDNSSIQAIQGAVVLCI